MEDDRLSADSGESVRVWTLVIAGIIILALVWVLFASAFTPQTPGVPNTGGTASSSSYSATASTSNLITTSTPSGK